MPFDQIMVRSLSGYLFFAPGLAVYCLVLARMGKRQPRLHNLALFVFGYYLIGLFTVTGIKAFEAFAPRLALIPFVDMVRGPVDTALNVVLFVPLGFFVPLLYGRFRRIGRTAAAGALLSLTVEVVQLFGMGATDINDLLTNTAGTLLGYGLFALLARRSRRTGLRAFRAAGADTAELLLLTGYALLVMVTVQPVFIRTLFGLG